MTRVLLFTLLFFIGAVSSCGETEGKHMTREKMTGIMTDIYLAEVYSSVVNDSTGLSANKNYDSLARYYKSVLSHHGVSLDEFRASLAWYSSHPQELDSVYTNVLNELSTLEGVQNAAQAQ